MTKQQAEKYLRRIGYTGEIAPTPEFLAEVQTLHFYSVPYENLDILLSRPLSLEPEALYEKIVVNKRGGYCFELNGLYAELLRSVGFRVTEHFARFLLGTSEIPKRRHRVLAVECAGKSWLCDVGVGIEMPRRPLLFEDGLPQKQGGIVYTLSREPFFGRIISEHRNGAERRVFSFTEEEHITADFTAISYFCEHSPESIFNRVPMLSVKTPEGRNTLDALTFRRFAGDTVDERPIESAGEMQAVLGDVFGIELSAAEVMEVFNKTTDYIAKTKKGT